ncbi:MAG: hypothetical protein BWY81_01571 [Firmicutes bacterium ADurb.Bin467]|nr:MAG: hypothetical protein BWY81_01571 [Firmicutes bacterium ADurb.Bin467]
MPGTTPSDASISLTSASVTSTGRSLSNEMSIRQMRCV